MSVYDYRLLACPPRQSATVARDLVDRGLPGGLVFGVFTAQIGLPRDQMIMMNVWPDAASVRAPTLPAGVTIAEQALWDATIRPAEGAVIAVGPGIVTHRKFTVRDEDVAEFLALSGDAWDNFEETQAARPIGMWRSRTPAGPDLADMRLVTWYSDLAAWDASRFWTAKPNPATAAAHARFKARGEITIDTNVVVTGRVV